MRQVVFALVIAVAACGSSTPTSPSGTLSNNTPLAAGRYSFTVTTGTSAQNPFVIACLSIRAGEPTGSMPVSNGTFVVVAADAGAGGLTLQLEDAFDPNWTMTLRQSGNSVEGTVRGTARDPVHEQTVTLGGDGATPGPARLSGSIGFNGNVAGGQVSGQVVFARGGWSYSCAINDWSLNGITQ